MQDEQVAAPPLPAPAPPPAAARGRLRRALTIGFLALALLAWAWFLRGQLEALRAYDWRVAPLALLSGVLLAALYFTALAIGWTAVLRSMSGPAVNIALAEGIRVWLLSMVTRYLPGNIWHILSRAAMAGRLDVSPTGVIASATIEQLLTVLGAGALVLLTLPTWSTLLALAPGLPSAGLVAAVVAAGLLALHPRVMGGGLAWAAARLKRPELAWSYRYGAILGLLAIYVVTNVFAGLALAVVVAGLTAFRMVDLPFVVGSASLAWLAGYLSFFTPSGLGVRESVLAALLALVYPLPVAIVASLVFRLVSTLGELLAVLVFWLTAQLRPRLETAR